MRSGPSKTAEMVIAVFVPPACREEVLGDLHERYASPRQYLSDALRTVPFVIVSRVFRTADPQILLIQAFALYMSFLCAAWLGGGALLHDRWGLLRLAIPAAMAILGLVLEDAYTNPGRRLPLSLARGPALGVGFALAFQGMFWISHSNLAVPRWIAVYGCAVGLLLTSAVRMLFPPATNQLQGIIAPAAWLKQIDSSLGNPPRMVGVLKGIAAAVTLAIFGLWMADRSALPNPRTMTLLLILFVVAYQLSKRN